MQVCDYSKRAIFVKLLKQILASKPKHYNLSKNKCVISSWVLYKQIERRIPKQNIEKANSSRTAGRQGSQADAQARAHAKRADHRRLGGGSLRIEAWWGLGFRV